MYLIPIGHYTNSPVNGTNSVINLLSFLSKYYDRDFRQINGWLAKFYILQTQERSKQYSIICVPRNLESQTPLPLLSLSLSPASERRQTCLILFAAQLS